MEVKWYGQGKEVEIKWRHNRFLSLICEEKVTELSYYPDSPVIIAGV
jgi:hypothetical protein